MSFILDNRHYLFDWVGFSTPHTVILKVPSIGDSPVFGRNSFPTSNRFEYLTFRRTPFQHLLTSMTRKDDVSHNTSKPYTDAGVKSQEL